MERYPGPDDRLAGEGPDRHSAPRKPAIDRPLGIVRFAQLGRASPQSRPSLSLRSAGRVAGAKIRASTRHDPINRNEAGSGAPVAGTSENRDSAGRHFAVIAYLSDIQIKAAGRNGAREIKCQRASIAQADETERSRNRR